MHESARAPFSALADAVWRCTSSACTRDASRVHSACRAGACCSITAPLHHPQPTPAAEGGALRSRWHALGGTLSVARSLWLAEQHIATTAGSVRQVCAQRCCRGLTCPRPPQRVVRSEWRHTRWQYKSGSWPRAVRASLDRVSRVEGGGACCRWRLHRHEPRGGGRDAPCGVSRGKIYGERRRVRSPAARISSAVAPPALTSCRALREAAHAGAGASIATSLAAAVATHPAAALGATSTALGAV